MIEPWVQVIFAWSKSSKFIRFILVLFLLPADFCALLNLGVLPYPELPLGFVHVYELR